MRKPKLRELVEALKVLFVEGPYTAKFPRELTIPPETFRGKPKFDPDVCIGCGACSEVCPSRSIEVIDDVVSGKRTIKLRYDICNFCGQCHLYCTTENGIDYTTEYDLAALSRSDMVESVEKELAICEMCGNVAGTKDHLRWIAHRLGSLAYGNPTLILSSMDSISQMEYIQTRNKERKTSREDIFRILCPECRRKVYLTEEWG
ncbi:MAG TPA: 4Fe-4S dicluster domain-containing protein [Anaerolineae bacterium]|nr:4Fe-4S dicluster domain-containing protein [Anaerolineae bacterium]